MRIIFLGSGRFAMPTLRWLAEHSASTPVMNGPSFKRMLGSAQVNGHTGNRRGWLLADDGRRRGGS